MIALLSLAALLSTSSCQQFIHPADEDPCRPVGEVRTRCKTLEECPQAMEGIRKGHFPKICKFRGFRPDVCCPDVLPTSTTSMPATSRPLVEGAVCKDGPPRWYCKRYSECRGAKAMINHGGFPSLCSASKQGVLLVCCPPEVGYPCPSAKDYVQPSSSKTESPKQYLQPSSSTTESRKQYLQASSSTTESPKQYLLPSSSTTEYPKEYLHPSSTPSRTESPKHHSSSFRPNILGAKTPFLFGSVFNEPETNAATTTAPPRQTKADEMCQAYGEYVYKRIRSPALILPDETQDMKVSFCGRVVKSLIVGGQDAMPREFPHMARIGYGSEGNIQWLCGGSLISERFILSAAHCAKMSPHRHANWANLGDLDTSSEEDEAEPVTIRISERLVHPGYSGRELYHDIALFKLIKEAPLGIYIRPACLNTRRTVVEPRATATGWGLTEYRGHGSSRLQKVEVELVGSSRCNDSYRYYAGKGKQLPRGIVADYMLCAGGDRSRDACQGDSGGPLQIALESPYCMYSVIGVTSFGRGCATSSPGVYTNVFNYLSWIEAIVWPSPRD